ncbi:tetratricopeptide repeat protein, partial [Salmonella enterica]|nr:tetratricopeptide repeat protein [Salmonella enterica]
MSRHLLLPSLAALAVTLALPATALAQYAAPAPQSDADALAAQMRIIAAEPTNVDALAQAGELSTRVGDLSGAASLFARADKADPHNGRVKAGMAEVLLRSERPGEALRFFDQAE